MNNFTLSSTILLTGLTVVFVMLIILTLIIKFYGNAFNKIKKQKTKNKISNITSNCKNDKGDVNNDIIAVITAATYTYLNAGKEKYTIKSIKRVQAKRTVWSNTGILENTHIC